MINVNQITSQLAKMPDSALQQYAAMHKNDPYTVSLALAESNRRKEMRAGAMVGGQEQPKVVDQDIAGMTPPAPQHMLPEEQGIGQLPAQNLEKMAGGGIVAFDEGGEVPGYAGGGIPYAPYGFGNTGAQQQLSPEQFAEAKRLREMGLFDMIKEKFGPAWQALTTGPTPQVKQQETLQSGTDLGGPGSSPANTGAPMGQTITYPQAGTQPPAAQAQPTATQAQPAGIGALGAAPSGGGYEQRFMDMLNKGEVSKEDRMKELTDINKPVLDKMATAVEENKNKLKTEGEQNFYMSLIQGGLAAAGASGPNALQNLAQGFEKGAAHYGEGLKDLRKAAQENTKMELSMAEYEASGKKDALKSYYDHQDKMQGFKASGLATLMGHEISSAGQVAAAGAGANAQRNLMEALGSAPEGSALRKGFELSKQEGRIPMMYDAYVKAASDPMKGEDFLRKYPSFEVYKAGMGGEGSGQFINIPGNAPPSTAVLARKN